MIGRQPWLGVIGPLALVVLSAVAIPLVLRWRRARRRDPARLVERWRRIRRARRAQRVAPPTPGRLYRLSATALVTFGSMSVLVGGGAYLQSWYASWAWAHTGEAAQIAQRAAAESPLWVEPELVSAPSATLAPLPARTSAPSVGPTPEARRLELESRPPELMAEAPLPPPTPIARATAAELEVVEVDYRFFNPPEPGAHARLAVVIRNRAVGPSDPIAVGIGARWFAGFQVLGAVPAVSSDREEEDGFRYFEFPGLPAGETAAFELHVIATDDDVDPPDVRLALVGGDAIGEARPRTVAPMPRPGPARSISLPTLGIRAGVVQVPWEPPPFVVGQIRGSANLSEGNTVLVGHVGGPAGNVFARLGQLRLGDEVVAVSRGLEYRFFVSEIKTLENHDSGPTLPTDTPRVTLMTCVGTWNPLTQDYSHRLWVIAEPYELAMATIAANAERAAQEAAAAEATATAQAEADATATAVAQASATAQAATTPPAVLAAASPTPGPATGPTVVGTPPGQAAASRPAPGSGAARAGPPRPGDDLDPRTAAERNRPPAAGLRIAEPVADARVPRRFYVRGERSLPVDPRGFVWLFVRAQVEGSRWYPYPNPIEADERGVWQAEMDLGGAANIRHELRIGVVDAETNEALRQYVEQHPNEPLPDLPDGFWDEVTIVVTRT